MNTLEAQQPIIKCNSFDYFMHLAAEYRYTIKYAEDVDCHIAFDHSGEPVGAARKAKGHMQQPFTGWIVKHPTYHSLVLQ